MNGKVAKRLRKTAKAVFNQDNEKGRVFRSKFRDWEDLYEYMKGLWEEKKRAKRSTLSPPDRWLIT